MKKILLVAADPIEVSCIIERFYKGPKEKFLTTFYPSENTRVDVCIVGYGCCLAMANLSRHLLNSQEKYDILINLGFAGILKPNLYPLLFLSEISQVHKFIPLPSPCRTTTEIIEIAFPFINCSNIPEGIKLMSSDFPIFTSSTEYNDCDLVDMEGYGIASLAESLGLPYKLIKIGSDLVDHPIGMSYLVSNPKVPAELLADWFENYLVLDTLANKIS